jgi:putative transcriptional regulator
MKNRLKIERAILNITQEELAERIGVSRQTINSIETNRFVPSTVLALKLSMLFGKSVNDFFELDDDEKQELKAFDL